jgi:hypothetical protein
VNTAWSGSLVRQRPGRERANAAEDLWKGSIARHRDRKRQQNRWAWIRFFDRMSASHEALAEDYRRRAEALIADDRGEGIR